MLERIVAALETIALCLTSIAKSLAGAQLKPGEAAAAGKETKKEKEAREAAEAAAAPKTTSVEDDLGFGPSTAAATTEKKYTQEEVFALAKSTAEAKGRDKVKAVMTHFKITAMGDLKAENYTEFVKKLAE